ncbi:hypothetical protein J7K93_11600 [bacterium]|nr:hypothetical protein [bacterium]
MTDRFFGPPYGSGIPDKIKRRIIKEYKFPVYKPGIKKMIIDNENRIWVLTYEINDQYFSGVDIFDRQGIFLQRVWMSLFPEFVRDDKIYCIFDDGYGDAVSKVYAFVKNVQ